MLNDLNLNYIIVYGDESLFSNVCTGNPFVTLAINPGLFGHCQYIEITS